MPTELVCVSSDEVVISDGRSLRSFEGLEPDAVQLIDGVEARTLPRPGELLSRVATTNDVHFGELECGRFDGSDEGPIFSVPEGAEPYPAMMSRLAVAEIAAIEPDAVIVKGDLTAKGTMEQYSQFLETYEGAFGARLSHVRGNHDCYEHQSYAAFDFQEIEVAGAVIALLDTCRPGFTNGSLRPEQLEALDELGARSELPVIVLGHHPIWDSRFEPRRDDVFSLLPEATEALLEVVARRASLVTYAAGHTHRTHVVEIDGVPFVDVASLKDFPGAWCEYQIYDGGILQIVRRVAHPDALGWTEQTRAMFSGAYGDYAYGRIEERCRLIRTDR